MHSMDKHTTSNPVFTDADSRSRRLMLAGLTAGIIASLIMNIAIVFESQIISTDPSLATILYVAAIFGPPLIGLMASFVVLKLLRYKYPFSTALVGVDFTMLAILSANIILGIGLPLVSQPNRGILYYLAASPHLEARIIYTLAYAIISTICFGLVRKLDKNVGLWIGLGSILLLFLYTFFIFMSLFFSSFS